MGVEPGKEIVRWNPAKGAAKGSKLSGLQKALSGAGKLGGRALGFLSSPVGIAAGLGLTAYEVADYMGAFDNLESPTEDDLYAAGEAYRPFVQEGAARAMDNFAVDSETAFLDLLESADNVPSDLVQHIVEQDNLAKIANNPMLHQLNTPRRTTPDATLTSLARRAGLV